MSEVQNYNIIYIKWHWTHT